MTPYGRPGRKGPSALRLRAQRALAARNCAVAWSMRMSKASAAIRPLRRLSSERIGRALQIIARIHAQGALPARPRHRHRAGRAAAIGHRLCFHGAALADGDAAPLLGRLRRHRHADRCLRELPAGCRHQATLLGRIAAERLGMDLDIMPDSDLPAPGTRAPSSRCSTTRSPPSSAQQVKPAPSGSTRSAAPA